MPWVAPQLPEWLSECMAISGLMARELTDASGNPEAPRMDFLVNRYSRHNSRRAPKNFEQP